MRVPARPIGRGLQFNITPLIDVVFLLNIFFLVATYYIRNEQVDPVNLPPATRGQDEEATAHRLIVTVTAAGNWLIGGEPVTLKDIDERLRQLTSRVDPAAIELRIRADRVVPFQIVEPMLILASRQQVQRVRFAVTDQTASP